MRDTAEIVESLAYWRGVLARLDSVGAGVCPACGGSKVQDISEVFHLNTSGEDYEVVKFLFRGCLECEYAWENEADQDE